MKNTDSILIAMDPAEEERCAVVSAPAPPLPPPAPLPVKTLLAAASSADAVAVGMRIWWEFRIVHCKHSIKAHHRHFHTGEAWDAPFSDTQDFGTPIGSRDIMR